MAIDYAIRDWIDDTDTLVSRGGAEFPRFSKSYRSKNGLESKPWGDKSEPVYMDPFLDENQLNISSGCENYTKGIWYYTGYPMMNHHDMAGFPNIFRQI